MPNDYANAVRRIRPGRSNTPLTPEDAADILRLPFRAMIASRPAANLTRAAMVLEGATNPLARASRYLAPAPDSITLQATREALERAISEHPQGRPGVIAYLRQAAREVRAY